MNEVDEYLKNVQPDFRKELERIRSLVNKLVPDAEESISYGMPAYKYKKRPLIYYAAFNNHMSIFPTDGSAGELAEELRGYKVSKGTIQFTLEKPLPDELIHKLLKVRMRQIEEKS